MCSRTGLSDVAALFARTTHIPELWIYSENDGMFWPEVAHEMFIAYTGAGGTAEFFAAPAAGEDGHSFIVTRISLWTEPVENFLRAHGLTVKPDAELTTPKAPIDPPAGWSEDRQKAFRSYLDAPNVDKAFALGDGGIFGWTSGWDSQEDASAVALKVCGRNGNNCKVVSVDGQAVAP